jgi:hypothetical protein
MSIALDRAATQLSAALRDYLLVTPHADHQRLIAVAKAIASLFPASSGDIRQLLSYDLISDYREMQFALLCSLGEFVDQSDSPELKQQIAAIASEFACSVSDNLASARWMAIDILIRHYDGSDRQMLLSQLIDCLGDDPLSLLVRESLK